MYATGYTTIYNADMRDSTLSLDAKGLFAVIKSFIGLPDFALRKRRLGYACSARGPPPPAPRPETPPPRNPKT